MEECWDRPKTDCLVTEDQLKSGVKVDNEVKSMVPLGIGRWADGKKQSISSSKVGRRILLGRKNRSETNLKVIGQVTVTRQEFFSFCCANLSKVNIKKVPNIIKIRRLTIAVSTKELNKLWEHHSWWFHSRNNELLLPWNKRINNSPFRPLLPAKLQSRNDTRRRAEVYTGWFCHVSLNTSSSKGEYRVTHFPEEPLTERTSVVDRLVC